jgi:hypothetical protein
LALMTAFISPSNSLRFWLLLSTSVEAVSIVVIAAGCWGEGWSERHHAVGRLKRFFWKMVVWGLAVELLAFTVSFIAANIEIERLQSANSAQATQIHTLWIRQGPRYFRLLNFGFLGLVKSRPTGQVVILFEDNNREVKEFAEQILFDLQGGGWKVLSFSPFTPEQILKIAPPSSTNTIAFELEEAGARDGLAITAHGMDAGSAANGLMWSFTECSIECTAWGGPGFPPDDTVYIFVMKKL